MQIKRYEAKNVQEALDKIKTTLAGGGLGRHVNWIEKLIADDYSSLDIAAALLKLMVGADVSDQPAPASGGSTGPMVKLFINIGKDRNVQVKDIVGSIANETKIPGQLIGKIRILNKYSFVEVPEAYADEVINSMQDNQIRGVTVTIERENIRSKR